MKIFWTDIAISGFEKTIKWLLENWSQKEVDNFILKTEKIVATIEVHPESCRPSQKRKNTRIAIINKHILLVYYYNKVKKEITLLQFWSMKQNPRKFKYKITEIDILNN